MTRPDRLRVRMSRRIRPTRATEESTAYGIYGVVVSAAVMAASHAKSPTAVAVAALLTLVIYWGAERYARLIAERIHEGQRPSWAQVRRQLTAGWGIVTASGLPLLVLVVLGLLGSGVHRAVSWALACSTLLLCLAGWEIGRHGHLTRVERLVSTVVAGLFGVVFIVLKAVLH